MSTSAPESSMRATAARILAVLALAALPGTALAGVTVLTVEDLALHFITAPRRTMTFLEDNPVVMADVVTAVTPPPAEAPAPGRERPAAPAVVLGRFHGDVQDDGGAGLSLAAPGDTAYLYCTEVRRDGPLYRGRCRVAAVRRRDETVYANSALLDELRTK